MDLSISPDLEAYHCYLVVTLVGLFVAFTRVADSLSGFNNVWIQWRTWTLLAIYSTTPIVLFWVLDRTGAIKDTSLFAALLVGVGYERILAGSDATLQTSQNISQLWSPLLAFANRTADKIGARAYRRDLRIRRKMVSRISDKSEQHDAFMALAEAKALDLALFQESRAAIDADNSLSDEMKRERETELAYDEVTADEDHWFELKEKGIITHAKYIWHQYQCAGKLAVTSVAVVLAAALYFVSRNVELETIDQRYAVWRLQKPDISIQEKDRAEKRILKILIDGSSGSGLLERLEDVLRRTDTTVENVDSILNILLSNRCTLVGLNYELGLMLTDGLNTPNSDSRGRIHRTLVYLADIEPEGLKDWDPGVGDSVVDLQKRIDIWRRHWLKNPVSLASLHCES